jgi:hypothetical protein
MYTTISTKSKRLADDIAFVARSLGFAAYPKPVFYALSKLPDVPNWNIGLSGELDSIPVLLPRKKCPKRKVMTLTQDQAMPSTRNAKDVLKVGIRVEPCGIGEFYGFELDGDQLFVLGDFTVTHNSPMEYGYVSEKLNLHPKGGFDSWIAQNFAHEKIGDRIVARLDPVKQAKFRQQLIERGQMVSQAISYDGYTAHFGVVPVTDDMKIGLDHIREGFARARHQLVQMGKKGMAEKAAAFEAVYTKNFLERERIPQAVELAKQARDKGWKVIIFSENSADDLFGREREAGADPSPYQELDDAMGGMLSKMIPRYEDVYDRLRMEFGDRIGDYSGRGNTMAGRRNAKADFMAGKTDMLYSTYAAGGIGIDLHDADFPDELDKDGKQGIKGGDKPRVAIFLGPPYSGVLLEQAMGRTWRNGVLSNSHAVFLATDSEPDIRLMQTKIGPRMRALRAAVLGEKDSLASAMATYTDEEKVRARQDAMAYAEGDEVKVNPAGYQVRSKTRQVGINDWSQINFPHADTAKNKGMKYGEEVAGGDWTTLYQDKFGMNAPDSPEDSAGKKVVNEVANAAVSGKVEAVQNLDPSDRDAVVGSTASVATDAVEADVKRDKTATARQAMEAGLHLPGDPSLWKRTFPKGSKKAVWVYTGSPEDLGNAFEGIPTKWDKFKSKFNLSGWYGGSFWTQEVGIRSITRRAGMPEVGEEINRINRSYEADRESISSPYVVQIVDIAHENKLNFNDAKVMDEVFDVVKGKKVSENPAINRAAAEIADLNELVHDAMADADIKLTTPQGTELSWKKISRDRNYMPGPIDWDAKLKDPSNPNAEPVTLKDVMNKTFAEDKRKRIIESIISGRKNLITGEPISYDEAVDYLKKESSIPVIGEFQRARTIDFPFIKKDYHSLIRYYLHAGDVISLNRNFGKDRVKLNKEINKLPNEGARRTIKAMFDGLLEPGKWDDPTAKIYNLATAYEVGSKMTLSVAKVLFHGVSVPLGLKGRMRPPLKALVNIALHPKEVFENATFTGTLARQVNAADVISEASDQGITHSILEWTGFNAGYKLVRVFAGESARVWMDQYAIHELEHGNKAEARRILKDVMLIGDNGIDEAIANGRFSQTDMAKAQTAFANLTTWSNNSLQMPGWARLHIAKDESWQTVSLKRAVRLTYGLQSFSLRMASLLREQLWDEVMIHHNLKPLAYFAAISYPVGTALQGTGFALKHGLHHGMELATGREHEKDRWDEFWEEKKDLFENPTGAKWAKDYFDAITLGFGMEMARIACDPFLNLAAGNYKKAGQEFGYMPKDMAEHFVGPAWMDLWKTVIELPTDIGKIQSGQKHPEQKEQKRERTYWKWVGGQVPGLRLFPYVEEKMSPPP